MQYVFLHTKLNTIVVMVPENVKIVIGIMPFIGTGVVRPSSFIIEIPTMIWLYQHGPMLLCLISRFIIRFFRISSSQNRDSDILRQECSKIVIYINIHGFSGKISLLKLLAAVWLRNDMLYLMEIQQYSVILWTNFPSSKTNLWRELRPNYWIYKPVTCV